jgi:hypothetical protein
MNIILNCTYNIQITDLCLKSNTKWEKHFVYKLKEKNKLNFRAKILSVFSSDKSEKFGIIIENVFKDTILKDYGRKLYLHPGEYIINPSTLDKYISLIQNELI